MRPVHPFTVRHRDVWSIALPATFAFITEPLAGLTDLTVIGRLGEAGLLGGVVLGSLVVTFVFAAAFFLRLATAGLTAQAVGARAPDEGFAHLARAMVLAVGLGLVGIALGWPIETAGSLAAVPARGVGAVLSALLSKSASSRRRSSSSISPCSAGSTAGPPRPRAWRCRFSSMASTSS